MNPSRFALVLTSFLATGCYQVEDYIAEFAEVNCGFFERCGYLESMAYESVDDCVEEQLLRSERDQEEAELAGEPFCADFDRAAAKECVEALENLSCDDVEESYLPTSCPCLE